MLKLRNISDREALELMLLGLEATKQRMQNTVQKLEEQLRGAPQVRTSEPGPTVDQPRKQRKNRISAEGRRRMAEAQRKRWAKFHSRTGGPRR